MGPAVVITVGVLILLHQVRGGVFDFSDTWPFILIVAGVVLLAASLASMTNHIETVNPPAAPLPGPPTGTHGAQGGTGR